MLAGQPYDPRDAELVALRRRARRLLQAYNDTLEEQALRRRRLLGELMPSAAPDLAIEPPFRCDYGLHIDCGEGVFMNFGCVILDVAPVTIGARALFGPGVQVYAATHPMSAAGRRTGLESGRPVAIGDDCWIGGAAIVCPGVRIGAGTVVGAGSVVTRDLPPGVFAAGNPCRVIRAIAEGDLPPGTAAP